MKGSIKVWNKPPNMVFHDEDLPDYLNDLNAMHEAEKVLTVLQQEKYCKILAQNFSKLYTPLASAGHRAEAFLRTLNLWKD